MILFVSVLKILWSLLNRRRRVIFLLLTATLFVAGLAEMTGMLVIFGFIRGLSFDQTTGERGGPVARGVELLTGNAEDTFTYGTLGGAAVILFIVSKNILSTIVQFGMTRFLMKVNHRISKRLLDGFLAAPVESFQGAKIEGVRNQIQSIFKVFSNCFSSCAQILADAATLTMVASLLIIVNPVLTVTSAFIFGGAGTFIYWSLQKWLAQMGSKEKSARSKSSHFLGESLSQFIDTRLLDAAGFFSQNYSLALKEQTLYKRRMMAMARFPKAVNEVLLTLMIVGSVFYLTIDGSSIEAALPTLGLFGFAGLRMTGAMSRLNASMQKLRQEYESFDKYHNIVLER
ncbi:MAG: hypothetical protein MK135_17695, partial [Polyangiaceae bacterium]|nr:hypothetical protein [Polyangiaceae bacterium]